MALVKNSLNSLNIVFVMRVNIIKIVIISCCLSIFSCTKETKETIIINNSEIINAKQKVVLPTGGNIVVDKLIDVQFQKGAFSDSNSVSISKISNDWELINLFKELSTPMFGVQKSSNYFIKINTGKHRPQLDVNCNVNIPKELINNSDENNAYEVFALLNQSMDDEELENFDVVNSKLDAVSKKLVIVLSPHFFNLEENGNYEAIINIAVLPGFNKTLGKNELGGCEGVYIGSPLKSFFITSPFSNSRVNPDVKDDKGNSVIRPHRGIDLRAPIGTEVYSAFKGKIIKRNTQKDKNGKITGWGNYVIIEHVNDAKQRFATLYAHLSSFAFWVGDDVNEGDLIGLSGNSGTNAPHLHFEYIINANFGDKNSRIDPAQKVNVTDVRLISASASLTGINNCDNNGTNNGSSWNVNFDYSDPAIILNPNATLTFQDIEPVTNSPYTTTVGSILTSGGLVTSPQFCAHFGSFTRFKVKVFITLNGRQSNCIYFYLSKQGAAHKTTPVILDDKNVSSYIIN
jgi:murein DD-endopeptidase MepM/ murein hydrolase activator NlpD